MTTTLRLTPRELEILAAALARAVALAEDGSWEVDELETFTLDELEALWAKIRVTL